MIDLPGFLLLTGATEAKLVSHMLNILKIHHLICQHSLFPSMRPALTSS